MKTLALLCFAAALSAQTSKTILGTVTGFKPASFEMGIRSDAGPLPAWRSSQASPRPHANTAL
jgi:hypothetical protein